MPTRNTRGNSRPLALCRVISCTLSSFSAAWVSPASSEAWLRKACSGVSSASSSLSKVRAALTSSSRFSIRAWAFSPFSAWW
ncbi:hypothetical protein D3C85_1398500 [compost metagenome]